MFYLDAKSTNEFFGGPKSVEASVGNARLLWGRKTHMWRNQMVERRPNMTDMTPSFIHRNCRPKH